VITLRFLRNRAFVAGNISAVVVVFAGWLILNETSVADRLVTPLLLGDSPAQADAIVALGAGVVGDCVPNLNSLRRVVLAARLLRQGRAPVLVITGGASGGSCAVADSMMAFARELGVPEAKLIAERESLSTWENALLTAPILRRRNASRILLVTDSLHMRRAIGVFANQGFVVEPVSVPVYEGQGDNVTMLAAALREAVALGYYKARGRM
jgi:uncharacterized SAM-binding protein YcdF (DUF218 family)